MANIYWTYWTIKRTSKYYEIRCYVKLISTLGLILIEKYTAKCNKNTHSKQTKKTKEGKKIEKKELEKLIYKSL